MKNILATFYGLLFISLCWGQNPSLQQSFDWIKGKIESYPGHYYWKLQKDQPDFNCQTIIKVTYDTKSCKLIIQEYECSRDPKTHEIFQGSSEKYYLPLIDLSSKIRIDSSYLSSDYDNILLHIFTNNKQKSIMIESPKLDSNLNKVIEVKSYTNEIIISLDRGILSDDIPNRLKNALSHIIKLCGGTDEAF